MSDELKTRITDQLRPLLKELSSVVTRLRHEGFEVTISQEDAVIVTEFKAVVRPREPIVFVRS